MAVVLTRKDGMRWNNPILRSSPVHRGMWDRRVHPDLRLEGSRGDRHKTDQEHIINLHETFTNPPPVFARCVRRNLLQAVVSKRESNPIALRTYGHTAEIPFELSGNLVGEFATWYWFTILSPVLGMNLPARC